MTLIKTRGLEIKLTEDGDYRPDTLIINDELASMTSYKEAHGYNWQSTAGGNVLFYRTESGKEYQVAQGRLQNTFPDEIREAMEGKGLTMREVSERLEIPYRTIQDWKAGLRCPAKITRDAVIEKIRNL